MIKPKEHKAKIEIDISGPHGNAFSLIGNARQLAKQLDKDPDLIIKRTAAGDYENLLKIFNEEFNDYVYLVY